MSHLHSGMFPIRATYKGKNMKDFGDEIDIMIR